MDFLLSFMGNYSSNFAVALGLWPLASFMVTLPIMVFLYRRDGSIRALSFGASYLAVLYLLSLVCFTLYPLPSGDSGLGITYGIAPQLNPLGFIGDLAKDGIHAVAQILANVAFFVPLGFITGRLFRLQVAVSLIVGFCLSLLIETAQLTGLFFLYPYSYRTFDVCDLAWNTLGTLLGWLLSHAFTRALPERHLGKVSTTHSPGFIRRCCAFCLDLLLLSCAAGLLGTLIQIVCVIAHVDLEQSARYAGAAAAFAAAVLFVVIEGIIPWKCHGSTPGGGFIRMSFETKEREGARRIAFFAVRMAVLALCLVSSFNAMVVLILLLFYLVKRCMPYDLLP